MSAVQIVKWRVVLKKQLLKRKLVRKTAKRNVALKKKKHNLNANTIKKPLQKRSGFFYLKENPLAAHQGCISITNLPDFTIGSAFAKLSAICNVATL